MIDAVYGLGTAQCYRDVQGSSVSYAVFAAVHSDRTRLLVLFHRPY